MVSQKSKTIYRLFEEYIWALFSGCTKCQVHVFVWTIIRKKVGIGNRVIIK